MLAEKINLENEFFGKKAVVLGRSGSGKSYTVRVLIEEGREKGISFLIIDPQNAYKNLPNFEYLDSRKVKRPKELGILLAATAKNIVISVKGMNISEQNKFLKAFLEGYRVTERKGIRMIVIDECHKFAPEKQKAEAKEEVVSMSQENRSDGLGFIAVEQRSQRLDKTVLSQADYLVIHQLTSKRDLMAVEGYLDDPKNDLPKIKALKVGQAFLTGFIEEPIIVQIRKANSEHSGDSPKNLLTEDVTNYKKHISKVYGGKKMADDIQGGKDIIKDVVPSMDTFMSLVTKGAKISVGMAAAGFAGAFASRFKLPIPVVSARTLASAITTIAMYVGYRKIKNEVVKDVFGYATAGAAVHTAGSLAFDILAATKWQYPQIVDFALVTMTGVPPVQVSGTGAAETAGQKSAVDTNTAFSEA